jgi:hypothetical protein
MPRSQLAGAAAAFAAANEPLDLWGWSELGSPRTPNSQRKLGN